MQINADTMNKVAYETYRVGTIQCKNKWTLNQNQQTNQSRLMLKSVFLCNKKVNTIKILT